jgi:single-strand DNA-binding protein
MNNVVLIGRLTRDPEVRYTSGSQMAVANFTLAIDRPVRPNGEKQTDFPRVVVFGRQAETCEKYLAKGRLVAVNGRIQTGSYQNRNGDTVYTTDVVANRVEFLDWGSRQQQDGGSRGRNYAQRDDFDAPVQPRQPRQPQQPQFDNRNASFREESIPDTFQEIDDDVPF